MFRLLTLSLINLFTIPSTRRNPLLADIFERLGYMERKGSGFGKIMDAYEFQINYTESKRPVFRSDRASFFVIMPNLNYEASNSQLGTQGEDFGIQGDPQSRTGQDKLADRLLQIIRRNEKTSIKKMSETTGVSVRTIKRRISAMPNVEYVGRGYSGHWVIRDKNND